MAFIGGNEYLDWQASVQAQVEEDASTPTGIYTGAPLNTSGSFSSGFNLGGFDAGITEGWTMPDIEIYQPPTVEQGNEYQESITAMGSSINPLASLPSISNLGAVPFSGVVNWNAIPGGFQPLPQVAGGKKKLYQLSQFHGGINQKSSPRDISDQECKEATNVTVSQIGRIKTLGDIKSTSSGLASADLASSATHIPCSGYGLYIFKSGYALDLTRGEYTIVASTDGEHVIFKDSTTEITDGDSGKLTIANEEFQVAPVFYASGGGLYANDANFLHTTSRQVSRLVYRVDYNNTITTSKWVAGLPLITSPTFIESGDGDGATGNTDEAAASKITLEWDDAAAGANVAFDPVTVDGSAAVHVGVDGDNAGTWNGNYFFYMSWLFDNGVETGLTPLQKTAGDFASGYPCANERLEFNFSVKNVDSTGTSSTNYLGGDARIEGARVYFRESSGTERYLLAEISLIDGIKGSLDSTFTPWDHNSNVYDLASNMLFDDPTEVYTYSALNVNYANEAYDKSGNTIADDTAGPAALDVRYKSAVVGQQGNVFIGNVIFNGKVFPDAMMYSFIGKPGVFPKFNLFDSPSSDGSPITALAAFQDTILQFKENSMYAINISNSAQFYAEASFRDCGVSNPCQVFTTAFGVIFANKNGCFVYDGKKVISLTSGKLNIGDWGIAEGVSIADDTASVPCVGYDPRSQSIIVLKNIGDDADTTAATNEGAWVYNMITQSWTEGSDMIVNGDGVRHSNFQISPNGYLSILQLTNGQESLKTYNIGAASTQTITYWTKDLDFGLPSQTKKLFKVYITYKGDADSLTVAYGVNGETDTSDLYHFSKVSYGGTSDTTPLLDKNSAADLESWHVATLYPDDSDEGKDWKSISLYFNGSVDSTFEINDISILYRPRPIK